MQYEQFTKTEKVNKHATLNQLRFQRNSRRWEVEKKIEVLERKFKLTSEIKDPEGWVELQEKLGDAYLELMNHFKKEL